MQRLRLRFTVRQIMILIVVMALVSSLVLQSIRLARRDRELASLMRSLNDYQRAADRLDWAERMHRRGYLSQAAFRNEELSFKRVARELGRQN